MKMDKLAFDSFALNDNKYQIKFDKYLLPEQASVAESIEGGTSAEFLAHHYVDLQIIEPHIATWDYLTKPDVKILLETKRTGEMRKFIESRLKRRPKGVSKIVFRELMYTVGKFCKRSKFNLEQTGAVLSQFYLTHAYFISSLNIGAEKIYDYFKNLQLCHSLPFPPSSIKLFNLEEIKSIMTYFCRLYLRNLPIINLMCSPNFTLQANYHISPEPDLGKKKKGKGKKKDKGKKKKKT